MHEEQLRVMQAVAAERLTEAHEQRRRETERAEALVRTLAETREHVGELADALDEARAAVSAAGDETDDKGHKWAHEREDLLVQLQAAQRDAHDAAEARSDVLQLAHERYELLGEVKRVKDELSTLRSANERLEAQRDDALSALDASRRAEQAVFDATLALVVGTEHVDVGVCTPLEDALHALHVGSSASAPPAAAPPPPPTTTGGFASYASWPASCPRFASYAGWPGLQ